MVQERADRGMINQTVKRINYASIETRYQELTKNLGPRRSEGFTLPTEETLAQLGETIERGPQFVATPFPLLNQSCRGLAAGKGLQPGSVYFVGGGPGVGKSLFASPLVNHSTRKGVPTCVINLEMGWEETMLRYIAQDTNTPVLRLEPGEHFDRKTFDEAAQKYIGQRKAGLYMNESPEPFSGKEIAKIITVLALDQSVKLFVIDFVQRIRVKGGANRRDAVESVSRSLDSLAKHLNVVILALSQLTRSAAEQDERTPKASDLQWSSALEQDARMVLILDHTRIEHNVKENWKRWAVVIAKNRSGYSREILMEHNLTTLSTSELNDQDGWTFDHNMKKWSDWP